MAKIKELMAALDDEALLEEVQKALEAGTAPAEIIMECQEGMAAIGELFSQGEMFVSDLMMAGAICKEVSDTVKPYMKGEGAAKLGKVVMGTVKNDIHDIGKDIVITMLEASGFEVIDVGVDAPAEAFVKAAQENDEVLLVLSVAEEDMGMIIGKHGKIARAIRVVMKAIAKNDDRKVVVEIK